MAIPSAYGTALALRQAACGVADSSACFLKHAILLGRAKLDLRIKLGKLFVFQTFPLNNSVGILSYYYRFNRWLI